MLQSIFISISVLLLISCSQAPKNWGLDSSWTPVSYSNYKKLIKKKTQTEHEYSKLTNIHVIKATHLTPQILTEQLKQKAQHQLWSLSQAEIEKQKLDDRLKNKTEFFLSVFSSIKKLKKMDLKENEWTARLRVEGKSYTGELKKVSDSSPHLKRTYPQTDAWSENYILSFPISSNLIKTAKIELILSQPQGASSFSF